jgi:hypothetical protein
VPQCTACPQLKVEIAAVLSGISPCNDLSTLLPSSGDLWNQDALLILEYFLGGLREVIASIYIVLRIIGLNMLSSAVVADATTINLPLAHLSDCLMILWIVLSYSIY